MSARPKSLPAPTNPSATPTHHALEVLRKKLGPDAVLLDQIPIDKVEMVHQQGERFDICHDHKIRLGTIVDEDGVTWTAWVYLTNGLRQEGFPEIRVIALHPWSGCPKTYPLQEIVDVCELRDEFRVLAYRTNALSVVLKACFMIKGAWIQEDPEFTDGFISELLRACRQYKSNVENPGRRTDETDGQTVQISAPATKKPSIRKSEQRGPRDQHFDALNGANSSPTLLHVPRNSSIAPWPLAAANQTSRPGLPQPRPQGPVQRQTSSDDFHLRKEGPLPAVEGYSMHLQPDATLAEYLDTQYRHQDIDDEIADIQANIRRINEVYNQRREELKTYIDKELSHIHGNQQRELFRDIQAMYDECKAKELALERDLKAKQLAEAQNLKAQYAQLKKEQQEETKALDARVQEKAHLKNTLQQDLQRKRKSLTKEQLLAFVDDVSSSRKRPRLEHGGKADNDEDG